MPCLNEAETIVRCIKKAKYFLNQSGVDGEVLIADNGSNDGSQELALNEGARVINVTQRGYGAALAGGIAAAQGRFIVMGDADDSYDFSSLDQMLAKLREGYQLVMGNRFQGGIQPGAMPFLHRYLGNPVLSFLGRLFFKVPVGDFHCGLRGFDREAILALKLETSGMEFASEMVVKSALHNLRIAEVPVQLAPDGRSRPPHLRTWRDGWRHLRFLLLFSPRWLFFVPGLCLMLLGVVGFGTVGLHSIQLGGVGLDIHTLAYAGSALVIGYQMLLFALLSKYLGMRHGWLPMDVHLLERLERITLEQALIFSFVLMLIGVFLTLRALGIWSEAGFGALDPQVTMRWVVPAVCIMSLAGETALAAFFMEALRLTQRS